MREPDRYLPVTFRRRVLIVVLALVTAVTIVLTLTRRARGIHFPALPPALCANGQTSDCIGGKALIIAPALPPIDDASASAHSNASTPSQPERKP